MPSKEGQRVVEVLNENNFCKRDRSTEAMRMGRNTFVAELKTILSMSTMLVCHLIMKVIWNDRQLGD
jgi:hypothetical protein